MIEKVYFVPGDGTDIAFPDAVWFAVMTEGDDTLAADDTNDAISTGHGEDTVDGGRGNDAIGGLIQRDPVSGEPIGIAYGAEVIDTDGNAGNAFAVTGGDVLRGRGGDDLIYVEYDSVADGGNGRDTAVVSLYDMWVPWVANTILNTFNDLALDVDLRLAATGSVTLQIGGLGSLGVTLTGIERYDVTFGDGSDRAFGGDFDDVLDGGHGVGADELHGRGGADRLRGQLGGDQLYGDDGADVLEGGTPGFAFFEDFAADRLDGGAGADLMTGGRGDQFLGARGIDTAHIALETSAFSYTLDLNAMTAAALYNFGDGSADPDYLHAGTQAQGLERIASLALGAGNDLVSGSVEAFRGGDTEFTFMRRGIEMGDGDDRLTLRGVLNDDFTTRVDGGLGDDTLTLGGDYSAGVSLGFGSVSGFETIVLRAGYDYAFVAASFFDAMTLDAGHLRAGDTLRFDLLATTAPTLQVIGGHGDDRVTVTQLFYDAQQRFDLGGGSDTLAIAGATGSTLLLSETSVSGVETIAFVHGVGAEHFALTTNDANLRAGRTMVIDGSALGEGLLGTDTLSFDGSAETDGAFTILGSGGGDTLGAGALGDHVEGGDGGDTLFGYNGDDVLLGGRGADRLSGGYGRDVLTGDAGADRFRFADGETGATLTTADVITDFTSGSDRIDLSAVDANAGAGGDQAFAFIGAAAFSGTAGELRYVATVGGVLVEGDMTGDGVADLAIRLDGVTALVATDFTP